MIAYLLEVAIIQILFITAYYLLLRNETDYKVMRGYLLISVFTSLAVPLVSLYLPASTSENQPFTYYLQPLVVGNAAQSISETVKSHTITSNSYHAISTIYIMISMLLMGMFFYSLSRIRKLKNDSRGMIREGIFCYNNQSLEHSFTFLTWIFIKEETNSSILKHEYAHKKLLHSLDILLLEIFKIFFWWTPGSWLAIREMRLVHEYQADAYVLKEKEIHEYKSLLIQSGIHKRTLSVASSFHHSSLLLRLRKMSLDAKSVSKWKITFIGILVALISFTFSCSNEMDQSLTERYGNTYESFDSAILENLRSEYPEREFEYIEIASGTPNLKDKLRFLESMVCSPITTSSADGRLGFFVEKSDLDHAKKILNSSVNENEYKIYSLADQQPSMTGNYESFYAYLKETLDYPKEAFDQKLEGKVFIEFIIDKEGNIVSPKIIKSTQTILDDAALSVFKDPPKFSPGYKDGKPVNVRMVLPVDFRLN